MDHARVIIFEDHKDKREALVDFIEMCGHVVVGLAGSMDEAFRLIKRIPEIRAEVAFVDGNLDSGCDNVEGEKITKAIKENNPNVYVICNASVGEITGADIPKRDISAAQKAIADLVRQ